LHACRVKDALVMARLLRPTLRSCLTAVCRTSLEEPLLLAPVVLPRKSAPPVRRAPWRRHWWPPRRLAAEAQVAQRLALALTGRPCRGARAAGHADIDALRSDNKINGTLVVARPALVDIARRESSDVDINTVYVPRSVRGRSFRVGHGCGACHRLSNGACRGLCLSTGVDNAEVRISVVDGSLCQTDGFPNVPTELCALVRAGNRVGNFFLYTLDVGARLKNSGSSVRESQSDFPLCRQRTAGTLDDGAGAGHLAIITRSAVRTTRFTPG